MTGVLYLMDIFNFKMKKLLFILLLLPVLARAQYPAPSGVTNFISAQFFYKISGTDTTVYVKSANGNWYPVGRGAYDPNYFKNPSKLKFADTIKLSATQYFKNLSGVGDALHIIDGNASLGSATDTARRHFKVYRLVGSDAITGLVNVNSVHGGGAQLQTDGPGRTSSIIVPNGRNWPEYVAQASTGLSYPILTSFLTDTAGIDTIPVLYHNVWYKQKLISGGVSSVGLSLPSFITVSGSPVTTSGTLTGTLANQSANIVFAGPSTGSATAPTFRSLVTADLPTTSVTPGTYTNATVTFDATGRATSASNGSGGGLTASNFVYSETPSGTINGSNVTFTLANTPTSGTVRLYENGQRLTQGALPADYTISGNTITFNTGLAPTSGSVLQSDYMK